MNDEFERVNQAAVRLAQSALQERRLSSYPPGWMVFSAISGGHMYGFPSPDSDLDIRGCHVLPIDDVIGLRAPKETFELMSEYIDGVEVDLVSHDIGKYLRLLAKNGGYILEQVLSPLVVETSDYHTELRELASRSMSRRVFYHYNGFFRRQREIVAAEPPLRAKSVLYLFRVALTGIHLLRSGELETDIKKLNEIFGIPYLPALWSAKFEEREKMKIPDDQRAQFLADADSLLEQMEAARDASPLPVDAPNMDALNDYLIRVRKHAQE